MCERECIRDTRASGRLVVEAREGAARRCRPKNRRVLGFLDDLAKCASKGVDDAGSTRRASRGARGRIGCCCCCCCCWPLLPARASRLVLPDLEHLDEHSRWCAACSTRARARNRRARRERTSPGRDGRPEAITIDAVWLRRQHGDQLLVKQ